MLMRAVIAIVVCAGTMGQATAARQALFDRGGGMIYDDVLTVTWLQDANYAKTSGHDADGRMTWQNANNWAENLVYGGFSDWRLPTLRDTGSPGCNFAYSGTDCGYNVETEFAGFVYSELAYMYYVHLGLMAVLNPDTTPRTDWGLFGNGTCNGTDCNSYGQRDVGLFVNVQSYAYWTSTTYPFDPIPAWYFSAAFGSQGLVGKTSEFSAWAVRDGDVARVPVPGTLALLGLGLGLMGMRRARVRRPVFAL